MPQPTARIRPRSPEQDAGGTAPPRGCSLPRPLHILSERQGQPSADGSFQPVLKTSPDYPNPLSHCARRSDTHEILCLTAELGNESSKVSSSCASFWLFAPQSQKGAPARPTGQIRTTPPTWDHLGAVTTSGLTCLWIAGADLLRDWSEGIAVWPESSAPASCIAGAGCVKSLRPPPSPVDRAYWSFDQADRANEN
jgi:hypothetical protein